MKPKEIALTATFTSLSVAFRVSKNAVTAVQFINIPLAFAFVSSVLFGARVGFLVGFLSYALSDFLIFPGAWTLVNATLAGLFASLYRWVYHPGAGKTLNFTATYILVFSFDILTSAILYVLFGVGPLEAFLTGLIGLFLPVMGGYLVGVGPLTEGSTSLLAVLLIEELSKRKV